MPLQDLVKQQIKLLENGKPLEAFKKFFWDHVIMRSNDTLFANNKKEGLKLQSEFIKKISEFKATVYYTDLIGQTSTLGIEYRFKNTKNKQVIFKGIHKQKWENNLIVSEDFYTEDYIDFSVFIKK